MANNSTAPDDNDMPKTNEDWVYTQKIIWSVYLIQAIVVGGSNFFIAFLVLRFKALRTSKEYLVILGLSLADGCHSIGYIACIRRLYLLVIGEFFSLTTPWQCMLAIHSLIWSFSELLSGLILLIVSIDRLLSVAFPLRYISWSNGYVKALFGFAYLYTIITGTVMSTVFSYSAREEATRLNVLVYKSCSTVNSLVGVSKYYIYYRTYGAVVFALSSIVVYGLVWILYKRHQNKVTGEQADARQKHKQLMRQRRLTHSLGVSCLCTIFVYAIPYSIGYFIVINYMALRNDMFSITNVLTFCFVVANFNPLCNAIIYYKRQPEIKQAIKALFTGKIMPPTLNLWKANTLARRGGKKENQEPNNS